MPLISFGILTVSDTCFHDNSKDASAPEAVRLIIDKQTETGAILNGLVYCRRIVPDEESPIMKTLIEWSDKEKINVIFTSGGTGFSERDVTPEATKRVIEKEAPGISLAMLNASLKVTPMAMLSRAVCGIRGKTLIINLPGSPKAVKECITAIAQVIPHAVALILNDKSKIGKDHKNMQDNKMSDDESEDQKNTQGSKMSDEQSEKHQKLAAVLGDVANRLRQSPFPMISFQEAVALIEHETSEMIADNTILVNIENAHGRILAIPVKSYCNLPPFRASIKDGYAVIAKDGAGPRRVLGGVEAGQKPGSVVLRKGECVRVNTGAPIPDGATAVVQVEDTRLLSDAQTTKEETTIEILVAPTVGQDIRNVGSDIEKGAQVLDRHTKVGAVEMGILAACGIPKVRVIKVPSIGILSTGNELQAPNESPKPGHVYDSNKITLMTTLKECGYESLDLGIVGDDLQAMIARIEKALSLVDVIVTSGSVSMGDKDMLKPVLKEIFGATIHFGRVSLKPGKPTTFATCVYHGVKKYFLCLPGNPVSATVTAHLFVIPLLNRLTNNWSEPINITAKLMSDYNLDPRPEFARAILKWEGDDIPNAYITGNQISSKLISCRSANALLMLPGKTEEKSAMKKGDRVSAMLLGFNKDRNVKPQI